MPVERRKLTCDEVQPGTYYTPDRYVTDDGPSVIFRLEEDETITCVACRSGAWQVGRRAGRFSRGHKDWSTSEVPESEARMWMAVTEK